MMWSSHNLIPDIPPSLYTSHLNIVSSDGGITPSWRTNVQQEHFEVEIHSDRNDDADLIFVKDIGDILNVNKYTCHICNIQVPNMYMKEHNNSVKHKTCIDIANIALERTKLQMQLDVAATRKVELQDISFCEPCSTVIFTSDNEAHEKTKDHKTSVKHDELLNELLKIYSDINNVEIESEIDELELLKQRIEAESLVEESLLEESGLWAEECNEMGEPKVDMSIIREEEFNALAIDIKSVDLNNKGKIIEDTIHMYQRSLEKFCVDSKRTRSNIDVLNEHIDDLRQTALIPVKKHLKNKALKKCLIQKRKDRFNRFPTPTLVEKAAEATETVGNLDKEIDDQIKQRIDEINETVVSIREAADQIQIEEKPELYENKNDQKIKKYSVDIPKEITFEKPDYDSNEHALSTAKTIGNKIDEILAKYFDKNRTVDALNNKPGKEYKHRATKKNLNTIEEQVDKVKLSHNDEEIVELNKASQELEAQKDNNVQEHDNEKITKQAKNIDKVQNEEIIEDNEHNNNIEQNKNPIKEQIKSEEHNNNYSIQNKNTDIRKTQSEVQKQSNNTEQKYVNQERKKEVIKDKELKTNKEQIKNTKEIKNKNCIESHKAPAKPKQAKIQNPSFNLVCYLKDIARKCQTEPIHSVEAVTDSIVQITAINGDKFKVLVNNFHSFHVKAQDIYCKVCESANVRRPEWHIIENEHRAKVMIPIHDHNGIRQLDDIWSHCILCNDLTKNIDFHLQSLLHKNKVKHCLVELGNSIDNSYHPNKENTPIKNQKDQSKIAELITKNNLAMTNKNYLNCMICDVIVNNDLVTVNQHITSFVHLNNFEQHAKENRLIELYDDTFYCIPCDVNISKIDIILHCKGAKHRKLLPESLYKLNDGTDSNEILTSNVTNGKEIVLSSISQNVKHSKSEIDESELICFVCNIILYCIDEHMDSFEHKKSYYSYLEANKLNEIEADTFYCIPCNTVITIDYLMSHCTSRKHKATLRNFLGNTRNDQTDNTESDKMESNIDLLTPIASTSQKPISSPPSKVNKKIMPLKVLYQFREMMDLTKLLCTVCDEEIHYSKKVAEYHVSTLDHVVAFNLMMLWNKIKKRDDRYFCDICRLDMTYFSEITHVLGKQHASNLAKEPKGTVYEYDRTLVTHAYAMSHKVGSRTRVSSVVSVAKPKKL